MSRIAYIFFGQVKNFDEKQYEAFQQNVGDKLKDHDVDYFLTTSQSTKYHSPRQQYSEGQQVSIDPGSIQKYFDFKDVFYDDQSRESEGVSGLAKKLVTFGDAWDSHSLTSTENSLKQLYGLEYFWHQFKGIANNYDVFVLSRCDLFHTHAFDVDCLNKDVDLLTPYYDGFEEIDYGQFGGLNDRFAVAKNVLSLAVYCARYSSIKNSPQYYHAEKYLKQHVEHHKLTTDKIHNFYFLLYRANCKISDLVGIENDEQMNTSLNGIDKSYFINLDRRLDRLSHIYKNNPFFTQRISAADAKKIQLNDEVKKLFPKTWSSRSKAEICCAISHYRLWQKLAHEKSAANYLILEDDAVFKDGFVNFWNEVFSKQMPNDYSIIYLGGCQPWNKPHYPKVLERYNDYFCRIKKNDFFTKNDYFWHMNASSYVLSKTAASLLCQWVEQNGMDDALDNFMQRFFNENKLFAAPKSIYHLNPLMSYQLHEENDNTEIDKNSDLRYADEKFDEKMINIDPTSIINGDHKLCCDYNSNIKIGKYCAIGENLKIITLNHDYNFIAMQGTLYKKMFGVPHPGESKITPNKARSKGGVIIGNDVCIGDDVFISSGVKIGDGCYIGAKSVVTKDLPAYSICVGSPCKKVKDRFNLEKINFLTNLKWWNWSEGKIKRNKKFFDLDINQASLNEIESIIND